jgi:hypothetical protein
LAVPIDACITVPNAGRKDGNANSMQKKLQGDPRSYEKGSHSNPDSPTTEAHLNNLAKECSPFCSSVFQHYGKNG